jgi:hypothetical protein
MNYIKRAIDIIRENSKAITIYLIYSFLVHYIFPYIFKIDFYSYSKEKFEIYYKMPSFYILLLVDCILSAFFIGGLWYSIVVKKLENLEGYFEKSIYFFNRFIILSFIGFLFTISMIVISILFNFVNRMLFSIFVMIYMLAIFYFGIKIAFSPIFIVRNDEAILSAFKNSFKIVKGRYFFVIFVYSLIKYFSLNRLGLIVEFINVVFLYILFEVASSKPIENQVVNQ